MKISYSWLKDFIDIDWPKQKTADLLTDLGLEIEGIEAFESVKGGLEGIVVGEVLTCEKHPNADRLKVTTVEVGAEKPLQIVCGAPNVAQGQKVPVALVGTELYGDGKAFKIKKSKLRGEESHGMICAQDELGLGDDHDGIMVLAEDLKPGTPLKEVFEVLKDDVFEIGLTPNRSDAMSHYGVARDLRAGLIRQEINTPLNTPITSKFRVDNHTRNIPVEVEDSDKVLRYCGLTMSEVEVKESPQWLKNRLMAIGLDPINNVVDAANYVMHDLGQPFHVFDADKIKGQKIIVKTLPEGTKFTTLDDEERSLSASDLMICDEKKPLCIAGVFGGKNSGVDEYTDNIFLESAYFDPVSIRKTAKRHGLSTDASFRFERGIDPEMTEIALKRLVLLIQDIAGGVITSDLNDFYPKKLEGYQVFLRYEKINRLIGQEIDQNVLKSILASLDIRVNNVTESGMGLTIPLFRTDVQREVDVIEEILRVYGYNQIDFSEKLNATVVTNNRYDDHNIQTIVAKQLIAQGFYEIMNNSLTHKDHLRSQDLSASEHVVLLNPLSSDLSVMRQSLLSGGLQSMVHNLNRKHEDLKFFEFGKTYHQKPTGRKERKHLSIFVSGRQQRENWNSIDKNNGFFFLKGTLDAIFERLGLDFSYESVETDLFSEALAIEGLGVFGVLKKKVCQKFDIDQEVLYADIDWDAVLEKVARQQRPVVKPIPKYPSVRRDFALLLDEEIKFSAVAEMAHQTESKLLKKVGLFDVYQGDSLPEGKKSYAVSFTFFDEHKTLTDKKVDKIMKKLRKNYETKFNAELR